jgi:hypothetical protein
VARHLGIDKQDRIKKKKKILNLKKKGFQLKKNNRHGAKNFCCLCMTKKGTRLKQSLFVWTTTATRSYL